MRKAFLLLLLTLPCACSHTGVPAAPDLLTVPERSDFTRTSTTEEVRAFLDRCAELSPVLTRDDAGSSRRGRPLAVLLAADPPVSDISAAASTSTAGTTRGRTNFLSAPQADIFSS